MKPKTPEKFIGALAHSLVQKGCHIPQYSFLEHGIGFKFEGPITGEIKVDIEEDALQLVAINAIAQANRSNYRVPRLRKRYYMLCGFFTIEDATKVLPKSIDAKSTVQLWVDMKWCKPYEDGFSKLPIKAP